MRNPLRNLPKNDDVIRVPITPAQHRRLQQLMANANAAAAVRDNVLSAIVESVIDRQLIGYSMNITETEIVLTGPAQNGQAVLSQADAMSP